MTLRAGVGSEGLRGGRQGANALVPLDPSCPCSWGAVQGRGTSVAPWDWSEMETEGNRDPAWAWGGFALPSEDTVESKRWLQSGCGFHLHIPGRTVSFLNKGDQGCQGTSHV